MIRIARPFFATGLRSWQEGAKAAVRFAFGSASGLFAGHMSPYRSIHYQLKYVGFAKKQKTSRLEIFFQKEMASNDNRRMIEAAND